MKIYINLTIYSLFFSIYFFDGFLGPGLVNKGLHLIPGKLSWASEILLCLVSVFLFAIFAVKQKIAISINYIYFFIIFIIFLLLGIILNALSPGTIFSGVRRYLLFWPLFFLPSVCEFTEAEIKLQIKFIAFVSILQVPFAIFQRFYFYEGLKTGDFVTGTLLSSPILTLNQLICIAVLTSLYVKGLVKLPSFLILFILFFIPTTINETKATFILFPIAIAVPVLLGKGKIINIKKVFLVFVSVFVIMLIFIPIYSYLYKIDVVGFFDLSGEDKGTKTITGYLFKGTSIDSIEIQGKIEGGVGRIDAILFPFKILKNEPFKLLFGLGIGNVSPSGIKLFEGEYAEYQKYDATQSSAVILLWEMGLIGFFLYIIFFCLVFIDSYKMRNKESIFGGIALGWLAVIMILYLCFFYTNFLHFKIFGVLFFYASGLIVAKHSMHYNKTDVPAMCIREARD
jgi:hypothetical protein